ncbi:hypothetical protein HYPSUDRAFT_200050 [Hypholoma sublateritium FD-334 SS-4]|uniref:Uncharacterized protein n=1 Tax=Hypholoma sublateritium (strain FD-334 SS-4) TaxID=945553 RepID=A0A0D2MMJ8_HYPSF|nr:hypothetical protein HYPSUDRAFT_200050 [Hypholoma sublateritium FD-334 SS-4]
MQVAGAERDPCARLIITVHEGGAGAGRHGLTSTGRGAEVRQLKKAIYVGYRAMGSRSPTARSEMPHTRGSRISCIAVYPAPAFAKGRGRPIAASSTVHTQLGAVPMRGGVGTTHRPRPSPPHRATDLHVVYAHHNTAQQTWEMIDGARRCVNGDAVIKRSYSKKEREN